MCCHTCVSIFVLSSVLGKVRSAVGSAQLLISQKFQQFRGLCEQNVVRIKPFCGASLYRCDGHETETPIHVFRLKPKLYFGYFSA